jgi:hypothetical protein
MSSMVVVFWLAVLAIVAVTSVWSARRVRRRLRSGSAAAPAVTNPDPRAAANIARATIDATNGGGLL